MSALYKIGVVILKDRKILVGKKKGKFIILGGKIEEGESSRECLRRELIEEFGVELISLEYFGTFEDDAALDLGKKVKIETYVVEISGEPKAQNEIEKALYVCSKYDVKLGSILKKFVIPKLFEKGLIN